jgi:GTP-binding protein EngB required for normal cell division
MLTSRQVLTLCIFQIASRGENWKSAFDEFKGNIDKDGLIKALKHFNEDLDNWKNVPVKLAVTGKSGVGKSSFINAIRNLKSNDQEFAASSSSGNTTKKATIYEYPGNHKITLHDLPGFGTIQLPTNDYEKKMKLHKYDYILIVVGNIEENDIEIAKKLKEMKRPFCFVRSKIDVDILNSVTDGESEKGAVEKIKSNLSGNLKDAGLNKTKYFVISNKNRSLCQFNDLVSYIEKNLPGLKCDAVMLSILAELSVDDIDRRYKMLEDRLWKISVACVALDTAPVCNMDREFIMSLICRELLLYHKAFGFEQQIVKDILKNYDIRQKLNARSIIEIKTDTAAMHTFAEIELKKLKTSEARRNENHLILPFIKSVVSEWSDSGETFILLIQVLNGCRDDAKLVYSHLMSDVD